jgi:hypothetical protein
MAFLRRQRERESRELGEPGELNLEALSEAHLVEYIDRAGADERGTAGSS